MKNKQTKILIVCIAALVFLCLAFIACTKEYKVSFDVSEGTAVAEQTIKSGKKAEKPDDPTKVGHTFNGWFKNASYSEEFDFEEEIIKADSIVYAKWTANKYTVTYNYEGATGGNIKETDQVDYASQYQLTVPTLYNNKFVGWYDEAEGEGTKYTNEKGESIAVWSEESNKTLYAHWEQFIFASEGLEYTLINDDAEYMVSKGTSIPAEGDVDIVIPEAHEGIPVTKIADEAFYNSAQVTSVYIPYTINYIGMGAFASCGGITEINLPKNVTLDMYAFQSCAITSLEIPAGVTLKGYTFYDCKDLTTLKLSGDTVMGTAEFAQCFGLENINTDVNTIPEGNGIYAINASGKIDTQSGIALVKKVVTEEDDVVTTDYIILQVAPKGLTDITIPDYITEIGANAFEKCNELTAVTLPQSVKRIGGSAFVNCTALTTVNLNKGLISIGGSAFNKCSAIISITIPESVTEISNSAFKDNSKMTIYVGVTSKPEDWGNTWNYSSSSIFGTTHARPVIWGCEIAYDTEGIPYVVSFAKSAESITNAGEFDISAPSRNGYVFDGWYTNAEFTGESYESADLVPDGEAYAKWTAEA